MKTEFQLNQNLNLFAIYVVNSQQSQLNEHDKDARHKSAYSKRKRTKREEHQRKKSSRPTWKLRMPSNVCVIVDLLPSLLSARLSSLKTFNFHSDEVL